MNEHSGYRFDKTRFRSLVRNSEIVRHEFFQLIHTPGDLTRELLRDFVRLDYLVARGFAQFLAHLISRIDDPQVRMLLVENLWDEHGQGDAEEIHFHLYKHLLTSLGVDEPIIDREIRAPFLQIHYDIADRSLLGGVAVFAYANEFLSMTEFSRVRAACERVYPEVDRRYFEVNQTADVLHTKQLEEVLFRLVTTRSEEDAILDDLQSALTARVKFYDSVVSSARETLGG